MRQWAVFLIVTLSLHWPLASSARTVLAATPISRADLPWWRERHEAKLRELATVRPELIFLGDSITEDWEHRGPPVWQDFAPVWQAFYGDRRAVNLGFQGDTTASLLWRIRNGEAAGIAPKVAVVLIGANNLGRLHWSAEDTVDGIVTVITEVHLRLPATKVLLLGVLPSDRSAWATETTTQINRMLAERYRGGRSAVFLDLTSLFMRDGMLDHDLFLDGKRMPPGAALHPTAHGQALMAKAMEPILTNMLGDRLHP